MRGLRFFLDFDGTITREDAVDSILDRFADPSWKRVEAEWVEGRIGSRECLSRQLALVRASEKELRAFVEGIEVDPHLVSFLRTARAHGVPVTVLSDGFDRVIRWVLQRVLRGEGELYRELPFFANRLIWERGRPRLDFPQKVCRHGCANCKERLVRGLSLDEDTVCFVGDGLSDRFAAAFSREVFAKGELLAHCRREGLPCREYSTFREVEQWLLEKCARRTAAHLV